MHKNITEYCIKKIIKWGRWKTWWRKTYKHRENI